MSFYLHVLNLAEECMSVCSIQVRALTFSSSSRHCQGFVRTFQPRGLEGRFDFSNAWATNVASISSNARISTAHISLNSILSCILFLSCLFSFRFAFSSSALSSAACFCDISRITLKQYVRKMRGHKIDHVEWQRFRLRSTWATSQPCN